MFNVCAPCVDDKTIAANWFTLRCAVEYFLSDYALCVLVSGNVSVLF